MVCIDTKAVLVPNGSCWVLCLVKDSCDEPCVVSVSGHAAPSPNFLEASWEPKGGLFALGWLRITVRTVALGWGGADLVVGEGLSWNLI